MFLEELRQYRESAASAYHQFLLEYPKSRDDIFAFVEGKDDCSFYMGFIKHFAPRGIKINIHKCGKKRAVYETHEKINKSVHSQALTLFFVDKDYSDLLNEKQIESSRIYVTDYYSVENYLVDDYMLQRVWHDILHLDSSGIDFARITRKFLNEQSNFYNAVEPVTVWVIVQLQKGERVHHNDIRIKKIISLSEDLCVSTISEGECIQQLGKMCRVSTKNDYGIHSKKVREKIRGRNPKNFVRGKFEMWFFIEFIQKLKNSLETSVLYPRERLRIRTQLTHGNAVEVLGPRAKIPHSLEEFLCSNLIKQ